MTDTQRILSAVADKTYTPADVVALCAQVNTLRHAIRDHQRRCWVDPQPWDRDLWEVLNA